MKHIVAFIVALLLPRYAPAEQAAPQDILFGIRHIFPKVLKIGVLYSSKKEKAYQLQDLGTKEGYEVLLAAVQRAKQIKGIYNGMLQMEVKVLVLLGTDAVFDEALPFLVRTSRKDYLPVIGAKEEHVQKGLALAMVKASDGDKWYIAVNDKMKRKLGIKFGTKVQPLVRMIATQ
ncbi:MAG TPA: hypothetical protein EYP17_08220 [Candidatus Latescibacteria bacterium]|nr:hypothetical protein [Candidatus Latescibacterota bacterium]